jgi:site-specific recombinase XerD
MLLIRGKGARARRLGLEHEGLRHLRAYLDTSRLGVTTPLEQSGIGHEHLFLSETGRPLTKNGVMLLFGRLRKRAGIRKRSINPSVLRESFALRYLWAGGEPLMLQELLGYTEQATSMHYRRLSIQALAQHRMEPPGNPPLDPIELSGMQGDESRVGSPLGVRRLPLTISPTMQSSFQRSEDES